MGIRSFFALGFSVLLLSISVACGSDSKAPSRPPTNTPAARQQQSTPVPQNVCQANPAPATNNNQPSQFGYRLIASPAANASVQSPLSIQGQANPFEGAYSAALFNAAGNQIALQNYNKSNLQLAFTAQLTFSVSVSTPACLWVFERSGNDGSPINISQIPVTLTP